MKPRPTSLYVPLSDPQAPKKADGRPVSLSRSASATGAQGRPQLPRLQTTDLGLPQSTDARAAFETGNFADPERKKARILDLGAPLYTEGHRRLVFALRDECARLHSYSKHLAQKVKESKSLQVCAEAALQDSREECSALREKLRGLVVANRTMADNLQTATDSLAEVDAMFLNVSKKRMSRLSEAAHIGPQDIEPARPRSPTPIRAYGRSAVSLDAPAD